MSKKCAYCLKEGELTKEHIFPNAILRKSPKLADVSFSSAAGNKLIHTDTVIKDVCSTCNNIPLSRLDSYGTNIFEKYCLSNLNICKKLVLENLDHPKLCRWLLKLCYNSSRVTNHSDSQSLRSLRKIIIDVEKKIPNDISIFTGIINPVNSLIEGKEKIVYPNTLRVGVFQIPGYNEQFRIIRFIELFQIMFLIIRPIRKPKKIVNIIYNSLLKSDFNFTQIDYKKSNHTIPISNLNLRDVSKDHFVQNSKIYKDYLKNNHA